jgi:hypothetical protein
MEAKPHAAKRRRGRPSAFGETALVGARLPVGLISEMDAHIARQPFKYRDRSEFLRHVVADAIGRESPPPLPQ